MFKCNCCKNQLRLDGDSVQIYHAGAKIWTDVILNNREKIQLAKELLFNAGADELVAMIDNSGE